MKALILAGGRGSRLNELTKEKNKSMVKIFEKSLIRYNLDQAVTASVKEIIIVLHYRPEDVKKIIGNEYRGIKIKYFIEKQGSGLVGAIENAKDLIDKDDFILMLADEIVPNAKMKQMIKKFKDEELFGLCGVVFEKDRYSIGKTYTAMINEKGRAFRLIEKPKVKINNIKGTGHCILKNEIFNYIKRTPINAIRGQKELVDLIQVAIDNGRKVHIYPLSKSYINVNTEEDLNLAKELIKKSNPRVLIVHNQMAYYGGAELLIVEMANWLTKRGIKNDILTLSKSKEVENDLINTEIIVPLNDIDIHPPGYSNIKDILKAIKIFRKKIRKIKHEYDVINFHDFPVTWTLWPRKKPAVWFMNQPPNLWSKPNAGFFYKILNKIRIVFDRFVVRGTMDVITVSDEFNKQRARERYNMNSQIVFCGINHGFFSQGNAEKARKKFNLKGKFVLMQSGILTGVKNQMESLRTINKLKNKIPNLLLILTGKDDPEYRKKLEEYAKKNKLEKYVLFAGNLETREELRDLYAAANVGLFPIGKQGGWLAPFEMLCAGTPIVVSSDMGIESVIRKNKLGIATKDYCKAILEIYNNQQEYNKQANKAAFFIKNNLSWEIFTDRMIYAFKKAWGKYK